MTIHEIKLLGASCLNKIFGWRVHDFVQTIYFCGWKGWFRGMRRVRRYSQTSPPTFENTLAVCAIMKNEGRYLKEWIEFHRIVGVSKFFLYDNGCTDESDEVLRPYVDKKIVDLIRFPGERMQKKAYADCIERFHNAAQWIAFIDLDEFIIPCKNNSLLPILDQLPMDCDQLKMDWFIFGSNGQEKMTTEPVIKRFTRRGKQCWLEKSIVNPRHVYQMDVHFHFVARRSIRAENDVLHVNHYHCKSWEEYSQKAAKGDVMHGSAGGFAKYQRACFERHDLNDIEDLCAVRFLNELERRCAENAKI